MIRPLANDLAVKIALTQMSYAVNALARTPVDRIAAAGMRDQADDTPLTPEEAIANIQYGLELVRVALANHRASLVTIESLEEVHG